MSWIDKATTQSILAFVFVLFTLALFTIIILQELGGREALFLIIGYLFAWTQMVAIFYFRKKSPG